MKWLTILLVYILNIRSANDFFKIQKVILLENDFWSANQEKLIVDKGYLFGVDINVEREEDCSVGFQFYLETSYYLNSTKVRYIVVPNQWMIEKDIDSFLESPELNNLFLFRLRFIFSNEPSGENSHKLKRYKGKIQDYVTYKLPEKNQEYKNIIKFKCDVSVDTRLRNIKRIFEGLIKMKLLKLHEYIDNIGEDKLKEKLIPTKYDEIFNLCYFKDYFECLENLNFFFNYLCYFNLIEDNVDKSSTTEFLEVSIDTSTVMKVAEFKQRLCEKFNENLKKLNDFRTDESWKLLFDECCDYIKHELLNNYIFFPIGSKYNIDYYIEQLSNLIYESLEQRKEKSNTATPRDNILIFYGIINFLKLGLEKLQLSAVRDLCGSEYVPKHFSKLLEKEGKKLDDYIEVEKMFCDYYNMFVHIFNLYLKKKNLFGSYDYLPPISTDDFKQRIIYGIKVDFDYPPDFEHIRGKDKRGKVIVMVENNDYFIDELDALYFPSEALKRKDIEVIEIISFEKKKNIKFKVGEYLSI